MKFASKEALVLGGLYATINTALALCGLSQLPDIISPIFYVCLIMLCFNKTPKFLLHIINAYPKTSYYLSSFGWIPYVQIIIGVFLIIAYSVSHTPYFVDTLVILFMFSAYFIPISLLIAYLKRSKIIK